MAVFRIRVGREINSAALIADGYHARTDGLTSLAVVLGAFGVWMGYTLADPIIGLVITATILGIVWQSAKAVLTRMLDGVERPTIGELRHAAQHARGVISVESVRARWLGHRLQAEMRAGRRSCAIARRCSQGCSGCRGACAWTPARFRAPSRGNSAGFHERDFQASMLKDVRYGSEADV